MDATIHTGGGAYALLDRQVSPNHLNELTEYAGRRRRNSMDPFAYVAAASCTVFVISRTFRVL